MPAALCVGVLNGVRRIPGFETAVKNIKSNMILYYSDLDLTWDDDRKLEAYRACKPWNIRVGSDIGFAMTLEDGEQFFLAELHIEEASCRRHV